MCLRVIQVILVVISPSKVLLDRTKQKKKKKKGRAEKFDNFFPDRLCFLVAVKMVNGVKIRLMHLMHLVSKNRKKITPVIVPYTERDIQNNDCLLGEFVYYVPNFLLRNLSNINSA